MLFLLISVVLLANILLASLCVYIVVKPDTFNASLILEESVLLPQKFTIHPVMIC